MYDECQSKMVSLRTSAHTGVAIRSLAVQTDYLRNVGRIHFVSMFCELQLRRRGMRIATPDDIGHWFAMTSYFSLLQNLIALQTPIYR